MIKQTKNIIVLLLFFLASINLQAQDNKKVKEIDISTSAQCQMCKDKIESTLKAEKGVKSATLDLTTKIVTVEYKNWETQPEKLRKALTEIGYDADDMQADEEAYKNLPACCKKPWDR